MNQRTGTRPRAPARAPACADSDRRVGAQRKCTTKRTHNKEHSNTTRARRRSSTSTSTSASTSATDSATLHDNDNDNDNENENDAWTTFTQAHRDYVLLTFELSWCADHTDHFALRMLRQDAEAGEVWACPRANGRPIVNRDLTQASLAPNQCRRIIVGVTKWKDPELAKRCEREWTARSQEEWHLCGTVYDACLMKGNELARLDAALGLSWRGVE